jgi:hypothetical protein
MRLLALLLCIAATASAQGATRWQEIGKTSTGNVVYVDSRSIKDSAGMKVAVVRTVYTDSVPTPAGPITGSRSRAVFNCAEQKVAVLENIIYHDERANRIYRRSAPRVPGYSVAPTSSFAHVAMQHLCAPRRP